MIGRNRHIGESELLRLLDGEGTVAERAGWNRHMTECAQCRRRHGALAALAADVSAEIGTIRPAPALLGRTPDATSCSLPYARPQQHGRAAALLRAAAVTLVLALPLLAVSPLRAWIVERARDLLQPAPVAAPDLTATASPGDPAAGDGEIRFVPRTTVFRVEVGSLQTSGTLTVTFGGGDAAAVAVLAYADISSTDGVLVTEEYVRIENTRGSNGTYHLLLPPGVREVQVLLPRGGRHLLHADSTHIHTTDLRTARSRSPGP